TPPNPRTHRCVEEEKGVDREIRSRWHHPAHAHPPGCRPARPAGRAHIGRMSLQLGVGRAVGGVIAPGRIALAGHQRRVRGLGVGGVIVAYAAIDAGSALVVSNIAERRLRFSDAPDAEQRKELRLRSTLPLATAGIMGSAYERVDIWLVALLKGSASVGLYAAAYKLYDAVLMPAPAL